MIIYYEGEEFIQRNIQLVFDTLNTTFYKGENTKFTFEKYVSIHLEAHNLLLEGKYNNELGMDNATKIQHFQSGNKVDAGLEHVLTTVRRNRLVQGYFQTYVSFLSSAVDNKSIRKNQFSSTRSRVILGVLTVSIYLLDVSLERNVVWL